MADEEPLIIPVEGGPVSAVLRRPAGAHAFLAFAHGAGAGMRHRFMEAMAQRLDQRGIATLRYQFPYLEQGRKRPDPEPLLRATVHAALAAAAGRAGGLPLFGGGKSMGGRMTSLALADSGPAGLQGVVYFGFPLHAPGRKDASRAAHLEAVGLPMLFLQGSRDHLADLRLLGPVVERLGDRARLEVIEGADHGFHVLKSSGRRDDQVLDQLADLADAWMRRIAGARQDHFSSSRYS